MQLLSSGNGLLKGDLKKAAVAAAAQSNMWDLLLGARIGLQPLLDSSQSLPVCGADFEYTSVEGNDAVLTCLGDIEGELIDMMVLQSGHDPAEVKGKSKKRKTLSLDEQWERLSAAQTALHPYWESVIDKWYTRAHFGIEKNGRSNLFRQTIWEQVRCIHVHVPINDNSLLVHILCTLDSWRYSRSRSMYREILHADGRVHSNGFALAVIIVECDIVIRFIQCCGQRLQVR